MNLDGEENNAIIRQQRTVQIPGVNGYLRHGDTVSLEGIMGTDTAKTYSTNVLNDPNSVPLMLVPNPPIPVSETGGGGMDVGGDFGSSQILRFTDSLSWVE